MEYIISGHNVTYQSKIKKYNHLTISSQVTNIIYEKDKQSTLNKVYKRKNRLQNTIGYIINTSYLDWPGDWFKFSMLWQKIHKVINF